MAALQGSLVNVALAAAALASGACANGQGSQPAGGESILGAAGAIATSASSGGAASTSPGWVAGTGGSELAGSGGASPVAGGAGNSDVGTSDAGAPSGGTASVISVSASQERMLWTAVRHHRGAIPSGRTNGPAQGPEQALFVRNTGMTTVTLTASMAGPGAGRFRIVAPSSPFLLESGAGAEVRLALTTDDAELGPAPTQDDGATVLAATLELQSQTETLSIPCYALVLTYAELEPTFGQILRAFPRYTTQLPPWLADDANPNPPDLPGLVAGTDEVNAPAFERLDATKPVRMSVLARFSPPGLVPFGWYEAGNARSRVTVASLGQARDPQTNDQSRMLEPPLASGSSDFVPATGRFGLWLQPAGVGLLTSDDADGFDGKHRVRTWALRDALGAILPGTFLIGGEEAANADYQDYVFLLENVRPAP